VFINFHDKPRATGTGIKNWFLCDETIKITTEISALQVYEKFLDDNARNRYRVPLVTAINAMTANISQILKLREDEAMKYDGSSEFDQLILEAKYAEHRALLAELPDWDTLNNCGKTCDDKIFFVELINHISEKVAGTQKKLNRHKNL
jgi:hypothetical protein